MRTGTGREKGGARLGVFKVVGGPSQAGYRMQLIFILNNLLLTE